MDGRRRRSIVCDGGFGNIAQGTKTQDKKRKPRLRGQLIRRDYANELVTSIRYSVLSNIGQVIRERIDSLASFTGYHWHISTTRPLHPTQWGYDRDDA